MKRKKRKKCKIKSDVKAVQLKSPRSPKPPSSSLFSKNLLERSKCVRLRQGRPVQEQSSGKKQTVQQKGLGLRLEGCNSHHVKENDGSEQQDLERA